MEEKKGEKRIYYVNSIYDEELLNQLEWSKNKLFSSKTSESNLNLYQGQIIYYEYYSKRAEKFLKNLALVLDDSYDFENNTIICPLIPYRTLDDKKLGINIGKILCVSTEYDFIAVIPEIKRISKDYIRVNKALTNSWVNEDDIIKIIKNYRNMLDKVIEKNSKLKVCGTC